MIKNIQTCLKCYQSIWLHHPCFMLPQQLYVGSTPSKSALWGFRFLSSVGEKSDRHFPSRTNQRYACISSWWQRVRVFSIQALFRFRWPPQGTSGYKHYHSCLKMFIVQDCKYCKLQIEKAISQEYTQGKSSSHGVLQTDGMCALVQGGEIKLLGWRGQMRILSRGQLKDRFGIRHPPSEGP